MIDLLVISSDWARFKLDLPMSRTVDFWSLLLLLLLVCMLENWQIGICNWTNSVFPVFLYYFFSFLIASTFSIQLMTTNRIGRRFFLSLLLFLSELNASPLHTKQKICFDSDARTKIWKRNFFFQKIIGRTEKETKNVTIGEKKNLNPKIYGIFRIDWTKGY